MKIKLRENAPWPELKLKKDIIIDKEDFSEEITDPIVIEQVNSSLKKIVEIKGEIIEEPTKKKRKLKEPSEAKEEVFTKSKLKSMLVKDIKDVLYKLGFSENELKKMKKDQLIDIYFIDKI